MPELMDSRVIHVDIHSYFKRASFKKLLFEPAIQILASEVNNAI